MPWRIDKSRAQFGYLTNAEQNKFDAFQDALHTGLASHPKEAARIAGDTDYKMLSGGSNQYQIRLSQGTRATFRIHETEQRVEIMQVGGHT